MHHLRRIELLAIAALVVLELGCPDESPPPISADASVDLTDGGAAVDGDAIQDATAGDGDAVPLSGPPYPIVLAHGFFGFEKMGPLDYYWKVKPALEADGHVVIVTAVDPFNSTYVRGEQLLTQVQQALAQTGAAKVNIVGHSQGGLDARYVAHQIPDRVGAVLTVSAPHQGLHLSDVLLGSAPGFTQELAKAFFAAVARPFYGDVASDADMKACLEFMSAASIKEFNVNYPDRSEVAYYSIGGRSNMSLAEAACHAPMAPPFITRLAQQKDPIDPLLYLVSKMVGESLLDPKPNDGLVPVESSKWGTWLGCIPADHWDQIGQLLGDSPGLGNAFDHIQFYRDVAAFLRLEGF